MSSAEDTPAEGRRRFRWRARPTASGSRWSRFRPLIVLVTAVLVAGGIGLGAGLALGSAGGGPGPGGPERHGIHHPGPGPDGPRPHAPLSGA